MAYSVYPAPSAGGDGGTNIEYIAMPDGSKYYVSTVDYQAGTYSLALTVANKTAKIQFFDSNSALITTANLSGLTPVVLNLATPATKIRAFQPYIQGTSGTVTASVEFKGAQLLTNYYSGTVETITSTQAVVINGTAYVIAVGGGGSGRDSAQHSYGGGGGGSGALVERFASDWSGAYTVTIGNGQTATQGNDSQNATQAGTTTVAKTGFSMGATGGFNGGRGYVADNEGGNGGSGTGTYDYAGSVKGGRGHLPYTGIGYQGEYYGGIYSHAKAFGVGGGNGGWANSNFTTPNLNNGNAGDGKTSASHATGYGNGGGGWWHNALAGNGSQGVVYIITGLQEI